MCGEKLTGLTLLDGVWHIDKQIKGYPRLRGSTGTRSREGAERILLQRIREMKDAAEELKSAVEMPVPPRTFRQAATRFLEEYAHQKSIWHSAIYLGQVDRYIGDLLLPEIDDEALQAYKDDRVDAGRKNRTINIALQRVVRVLNLCHRKWRDEQSRPWLAFVPLIEMLSEKTSRRPYPLSWEEQAIFFSELPSHLRTMANFKVNTGTREQEVCKLQWRWEIPVPELSTSVFLIPDDFGGRTAQSGVKNGEDRLVVLNETARVIIERQRGLHPEWVFPFEGQPLHRMNDSGWVTARTRAADRWERGRESKAHWGFRNVRVHDLKHTFGRRLRAADVSEEDRRVLLGHTDGSITSHYSAAELSKMIEHANRVVRTEKHSPALTILRRAA